MNTTLQEKQEKAATISGGAADHGGGGGLRPFGPCLRNTDGYDAVLPAWYGLPEYLLG